MSQLYGQVSRCDTHINMCTHPPKDLKICGTVHFNNELKIYISYIFIVICTHVNTQQNVMHYNKNLFLGQVRYLKVQSLTRV